MVEEGRMKMVDGNILTPYLTSHRPCMYCTVTWALHVLYCYMGLEWALNVPLCSAAQEYPTTIQERGKFRALDNWMDEFGAVDNG